MLNSFLSLIPPMLLGTQLILTLVLIKGEICPGQRGRLHKLFPVIGTLWLACSTLHVAALLAAVPVFYFYSQVQTKKTREKGPIWILLSGVGLSAIFVVAELVRLTYVPAQVAGLLLVIVLGGVFAQLSLKVARSRLDAFQKILPFSGIAGVIILLLMVALQSFNIDESALVSMSMNIFIGIATLIVGTTVWSWHLLRASNAEKPQLIAAMVLMTAACIILQPVFLV